MEVPSDGLEILPSYVESVSHDFPLIDALSAILLSSKEVNVQACVLLLR